MMMRSARIAVASLLLLVPLAASGQDETKPAEPKAASLAELLQKVKNGWRVENKENQAREARFVKEKREQERLLREAKAILVKEERRSEELEEAFANNEEELAKLQERLQERLGTLGELFGVVRQTAGDTRSQVEGSMISAEFPDRHQFLEALGKNTSLPAIADLRRLWFTLQQEMTESGAVTRFSTQVVDTDGTQIEAEVARVGPFIAASDGRYLDWNEKVQQLQILARQPSSRYVGTLSNLEGSADELVRVAIDPSRGSLLRALISTRTATERIQEGGIIGYAIMTLGAITYVLALVRFVYVFLTSRKVKAQVGAKEARDDNPLGRVLSVYSKNKTLDTETLELKLDEAILRESALVERYLWAIKVVAAIAPLMGLLGTVTGMIQTFQSITLFGAGDPKLMADGISVALVTTMLGLCVAIPLVFLHSLIASMAKVINDIIEEQSAGLVAMRAEED